MTDILVVVDMQKDFVDGVLGTKEAVAIVSNVASTIREFPGKVFYTLDTHQENYLETEEGKKLPVVHCVKGTPGICVISNVLLAKANFPEVPIYVNSTSCAGVSPQTHQQALEAMKMCQVNVVE